MVDDRSEDTGSLPGSERPKRAAPTIDLAATVVSDDIKSSAEKGSVEALSEPEAASAPEATLVSSVEEPRAESVAPPASAPVSAPVSPWIVAPVSGAVAAALVIGVGWMLGWPPIQPASAPSPQQL